MDPPNVHHSINYVEFPATDLAATKEFYSSAFGWSFQDWGETYMSFSGAGVEGGFDHIASATGRRPATDGALVILYSDDLAASEQAIIAAGGTITVPAYGFPGGRRFHFADPNGNVLAVWSPT